MLRQQKHEIFVNQNQKRVAIPPGTYEYEVYAFVEYLFFFCFDFRIYLIMTVKKCFRNLIEGLVALGCSYVSDEGKVLNLPTHIETYPSRFLN